MGAAPYEKDKVLALDEGEGLTEGYGTDDAEVVSYG